MSAADRIQFVQGDITQEQADAVVNAANTSLLLGSGVAGAILRAGGASIQRECDEHGPVGLGEAAVTGAGKLPQKWIIHAAVMDLGAKPTEMSIHRACENSLKAASRRRMKAICFPALGAGVGGFPMDLSARILIGTTLRFLETHQYPATVRFVLYEPAALAAFQGAFRKFRLT